MEGIKRFIKQNPLMAALVGIAIIAAGYYLFQTAYVSWKMAKLEAANQELVRKNEDLEIELKKKDNEAVLTEGRIQAKEKELQERDELLQALTETVARNKAALLDATVHYNNERANDKPMSAGELRERLCDLYPEKCLGK